MLNLAVFFLRRSAFPHGRKSEMSLRDGSLRQSCNRSRDAAQVRWLLVMMPYKSERFAFGYQSLLLLISTTDSTVGKSSSETQMRTWDALDCFNGKQLTDDGNAFALPCFVFVSAVIDTAQIDRKLEMQLFMIAQCVMTEI